MPPLLTPAHWVFPLECPLIPGDSSKCPLTLVVPLRGPYYTRCPHQMCQLHQMSQSQCNLTTGVLFKMLFTPGVTVGVSGVIPITPVRSCATRCLLAAVSASCSPSGGKLFPRTIQMGLINNMPYLRITSPRLWASDCTVYTSHMICSLFKYVPGPVPSLTLLFLESTTLTSGLFEYASGWSIPASNWTLFICLSSWFDAAGMCFCHLSVCSLRIVKLLH